MLSGLVLIAVVIFGLLIGLVGVSKTNHGVTIPMMLRGFFLGLLCGAFAGVLIMFSYPLIEGTYQAVGVWIIPAGLFGALLGGTFGAGVGLISGLLLGTVTSRYFLPLHNIAQYQWMMMIIGIVSTVCLVFVVGWFLGGSSIQSTYDAVRRASAINLYLVLPAILGAFLAIPSSLCLVRWYIAYSKRPSAPPQQQTAI